MKGNVWAINQSMCRPLRSPSFRVLHLSRNLPNLFKDVAINYAIYECNFYLYSMVLVPAKPAHCMYEWSVFLVHHAWCFCQSKLPMGKRPKIIAA